MKRNFILFFTCLALLSGCSKSTETSSTVDGELIDVATEKIVAVEVREVKQTNQESSLSFIGVVDYKEKTSYCFKSTDRLEAIYVEEGQSVKKGDMLAKLNTSDLDLTLKALQEQANSAKAGMDSSLAQLKTAENSVAIANENYKSSGSQYTKALNGATNESLSRASADMELAESAYNLAKETYENTKILFNAGSVAKSQFDQAGISLQEAETKYLKAQETLKELENGTRQEDLEVAKSGKEIAKIQYENSLITKEQANGGYNSAKAQYQATLVQIERQKILLEDAIIYANNDGVVLSKRYNVSEIVQTGSPVVIIRDNNMIIKTGVTAADLNSIKIGNSAKMKIGESEIDGTVTDISDAIDLDTRAYKVEIQPNTDRTDILKIGEIVNVDINIGRRSGIWVPLSAVRSDGEDYLYVVNGDRATKKNVTVKESYNGLLSVDGLSLGDKIIVKGSANVTEGTKIKFAD